MSVFAKNMHSEAGEGGIKNLPRHVAIIMDGNGRWAEARGLSRVSGHREGATAVRRVVEAAASKGIAVLTLFAFSSENWRRPRPEVQALLQLFVSTIEQQTLSLKQHGIKTRVIGDISKFPEKLRSAIAFLEGETALCTGMQLNIAANYGGRWDIVSAARSLLAECRQGTLQPADLNEDLFASRLSEGRDIDLLIRTGGEQRISNFLLWQAAYSELYFSGTLWPDYDERDLDDALAFFGLRERRFGMISEQLPQGERRVTGA